MAVRWDGSREERHAALRTVFDVLGCSTLPQRKSILRSLANSRDRYHSNKIALAELDRASAKKWLNDVAKSADGLALLLEGHPYPSGGDHVLRRMLDDPEAFKATLRALAGAAMDPKTIPGANWKGRTPNAPLNALIWELGSLFQLYTGRVPSRSIDPVTSKPGGKFLRFVGAVLKLFGVSAPDSKIDTAIKNHGASPFDTMDKTI